MYDHPVYIQQIVKIRDVDLWSTADDLSRYIILTSIFINDVVSLPLFWEIASHHPLSTYM